MADQGSREEFVEFVKKQIGYHGTRITDDFLLHFGLIGNKGTEKLTDGELSRHYYRLGNSVPPCWDIINLWNAMRNAGLGDSFLSVFKSSTNQTDLGSVSSVLKRLFSEEAYRDCFYTGGGKQLKLSNSSEIKDFEDDKQELDYSKLKKGCLVFAAFNGSGQPVSTTDISKFNRVGVLHDFEIDSATIREKVEKKEEENADGTAEKKGRKKKDDYIKRQLTTVTKMSVFWGDNPTPFSSSQEYKRFLKYQQNGQTAALEKYWLPKDKEIVLARHAVFFYPKESDNWYSTMSGLEKIEENQEIHYNCFNKDWGYPSGREQHDYPWCACFARWCILNAVFKVLCGLANVELVPYRRFPVGKELAGLDALPDLKEYPNGNYRYYAYMTESVAKSPEFKLAVEVAKRLPLDLSTSAIKKRALGVNAPGEIEDKAKKEKRPEIIEQYYFARLINICGDSDKYMEKHPKRVEDFAGYSCSLEDYANLVTGYYNNIESAASVAGQVLKEGEQIPTELSPVTGVNENYSSDLTNLKTTYPELFLRTQAKRPEEEKGNLYPGDILLVDSIEDDNVLDLTHTAVLHSMISAGESPKDITVYSVEGNYQDNTSFRMRMVDNPSYTGKREEKKKKDYGIMYGVRLNFSEAIRVCAAGVAEFEEGRRNEILARSEKLALEIRRAVIEIAKSQIRLAEPVKEKDDEEIVDGMIPNKTTGIVSSGQGSHNNRYNTGYFDSEIRSHHVWDAAFVYWCLKKNKLSSLYPAAECEIFGSVKKRTMPVVTPERFLEELVKFKPGCIKNPAEGEPGDIAVIRYIVSKDKNYTKYLLYMGVIAYVDKANKSYQIIAGDKPESFSNKKYGYVSFVSVKQNEILALADLFADGAKEDAVSKEQGTLMDTIQEAMNLLGVTEEITMPESSLSSLFLPDDNSLDQMIKKEAARLAGWSYVSLDPHTFIFQILLSLLGETAKKHKTNKKAQDSYKKLLNGKEDILAGIRMNDTFFYGEFVNKVSNNLEFSDKKFRESVSYLRFDDRTGEMADKCKMTMQLTRNLARFIYANCAKINKVETEKSIGKLASYVDLRYTMERRQYINFTNAIWPKLWELINLVDDGKHGKLIKAMRLACRIACMLNYSRVYARGFLHAMDASPVYKLGKKRSNADYDWVIDESRYSNQPLNRYKIIAWICFCCDVYRSADIYYKSGNKMPLRDVRLLDYVHYLHNRITDPAVVYASEEQRVLENMRFTILLPFCIDYELVRRTELSEWNSLAESDMTKSLMEVINNPDVEEDRYLSCVAYVKIGELFNPTGGYDPGLVALGSALHTIIDSFSPSNTVRTIEYGCTDYRKAEISQYRRCDEGEPMEGGMLDSYGIAVAMGDMSVDNRDLMDDMNVSLEENMTPSPVRIIKVTHDFRAKLVLNALNDFLGIAAGREDPVPLLKEIFSFPFYQSRKPRGLAPDGIHLAEDVSKGEFSIGENTDAAKLVKKMVKAFPGLNRKEIQKDLRDCVETLEKPEKEGDAELIDQILEFDSTHFTNSILLKGQTIPSGYGKYLRNLIYMREWFKSILGDGDNYDTFFYHFLTFFNFDEFSLKYGRTPVVIGALPVNAPQKRKNLAVFQINRITEPEFEKFLMETEVVREYLKKCLVIIACALRSRELLVDRKGEPINYGQLEGQFGSVKRPLFDSRTDYINHLGILVHTTQGNTLRLTVPNYTFTEGKLCAEGKVTLQIYDHFGLDADDLRQFYDRWYGKPFEFGFAAWYVLQHCRADHAPYITEFEGTWSFKIDGNSMSFGKEGQEEWTKVENLDAELKEIIEK